MYEHFSWTKRALGLHTVNVTLKNGGEMRKCENSCRLTAILMTNTPRGLGQAKKYYQQKEVRAHLGTLQRMKVMCVETEDKDDMERRGTFREK